MIRKRAREPFLWGRDRGCAFATERCDGPAWQPSATVTTDATLSFPSYAYWCAAPSSASASVAAATSGAEGCTLGRLAVGHCTLREHTSDVPAPFNYFGLAPKLGGRPMEDYCPLVEPFTDWDCRIPSSSASAADAEATRGERRCEDCRCFVSSAAGANGTASSAGSERHGCYEHRCLSPTQLQLKAAGLWLDCPEAGGLVPVTLTGWQGNLRCPPASDMCAAADDLSWPEVTSLSPTQGPAAGGTVVTITGRSIVADGSATTPKASLCGLPLHSVRLVSSVNSSSTTTTTNASNSQGKQPQLQMMTAVTAPLPAPSAAELWSDSGRGRASLDVSCHLSLSGTGGP